MKLTIGENIRTLRREKNLTQEELAEIFGVTYQSVSRWENGTCYPDVEFLPDIATFFGVTVDHLMGADRSMEEREVAGYLTRFQEAVSQGRVYDCIAIAREGVAAYPNNYALLNKLMYALFIAGDDDGNLPEWKENMQKYDAEITELGERIMKYCPDTDIRTEATNRLAFNHCEMGRKDIGRRIYESLPSIWECREMNIYWALNEEERLKNAYDLIHKSYHILSSTLNNLSQRQGISDEARAAVLEKAIALDDLIYGPEVPVPGWGEARDYLDLARAYARLGRDREVLSALERTVSYAQAFDHRPEAVTFSNLLLGEVTIRKTDFETGDSRSLCEIVRDKWLASADFDSIRNTEAFRTIIGRLSET